MKHEDPAVRCVLQHRAGTGESPVWSAAEQVLYWVDIVAPALHRFDPASGQNRSWPMPSAIGSIGLSRSGRILCALKSGLHWFDPADGTLHLIAHPESHLPTNRFNDGKVSPEGRFWVGSMDDRPQREPQGSLYRLDPDGTVTVHGNGYRTLNGLAWSPDGRSFYHADTRAQTVWRSAYDPATGQPGPREVFVTMQDSWGRPDGAAVDAEGCYWVCGFGAGRVNRFSPQGALLGFVQLPVRRVTMPCFAGPDLRTVYVTSACQGMSPAEQEAEPLAGSLFAFQAGVPGVPVGLLPH